MSFLLWSVKRKEGFPLPLGRGFSCSLIGFWTVNQVGADPQCMHYKWPGRPQKCMFFLCDSFSLVTLIFAIVCCLFSWIVNSGYVGGAYNLICNNKTIAYPLGTQQQSVLGVSGVTKTL